MNAQQLSAACSCLLPKAEQWLDFIVSAMEEYEINAVNRQASFLGQIAWESAYLSRLSENLNYSEAGLMATFPTHFHGDAAKYARNPVMIANRVYASRMGNGDEASGDGYKFRGAGLIQLTGRSNFLAYSSADFDLIAQPDLLRVPSAACANVAAAYWQEHGCNEFADAGNITAMTKAINGGENNLAERIQMIDAALKALYAV